MDMPLRSRKWYKERCPKRFDAWIKDFSHVAKKLKNQRAIDT